jgi:hypothetical protein
MHGFGGGECGERDAEGVERLIVAPHADASSYQIQRRHSEQPDEYSGARSEDEQIKPEFGKTGAGGRRAMTEKRHRNNHHRQQHDVVETALKV